MTFFGRTPAASPEFTPPATVQSIAVLGAGSWGTAFAKIAADAARERGDDTRVTLIPRGACRCGYCGSCPARAGSAFAVAELRSLY